ncbi:MAG: HlyD family secretion protein [Eubacteriaceae bacterium]
MNKKIVLIVFIILMVCFSGCKNESESTDNYTGTVECESYYISSELSSKVIEIFVAQGDEINEGDEIAQLDIEMYKIQVKQAQGALKIAKAKKADLPSNVSDELEVQAQGAIEQAQAAVELAELQSSKGSIISSIDGIVAEVFIHKGELATTGVNIIKILDINNKYVKIYIEEENRDKVKLGQKLNVIINNNTEEGEIIYISPESEFTPKNIETKDDKSKTLFQVKLKLEEKSKGIIGMMVDVSL